MTAAGSSNAWDVTFVPRDPDRAAVIDFGPDYSVFDSTFMVRAGLDVTTIDELDADGRSVGAVNSTTTGRAAARTLDRATLTSYDSVDEMRALLDAGELDAIALGRLTLTSLAPSLPGTRILEAGFHSTATAVAVPDVPLTASGGDASPDPFPPQQTTLPVPVWTAQVWYLPAAMAV